MQLARRSFLLPAITALLALTASAQPGPAKPNIVTIDWNKTVIVSKSTPTLQVVVNPMTRPGSPIHDGPSLPSRASARTTCAMSPGCHIPGSRSPSWIRRPAHHLLGLLAHRSHDQGLSQRNRRPLHGHELQHHSRRGCSRPTSLSHIPPIRTRCSGITPRARSCATPGQGARRLLCAPRQLVHEGRLHRREREAPRLRLSLHTFPYGRC